MADDLSRRKLVQRAALLTALARLDAGCARRIAPARDVALPCLTDPRQRVLLSPEAAPELTRAGGSVIVRVQGPPGGQDKVLLVANSGNGFVAVDGICTHQGCELTWVGEDREVECPCHLSRYASDGTVLNPPAVAPLSSYPAALDPSGGVAVALAPGDGVFPAVQNSQLVIALASYPALQSPGGAVVGHAEGHVGPIVIARQSDGSFVAFDGACTHLGCEVHPAQAGVLHCPCHGSTFSISPDPSDPRRAVPGWVITGPAGPPLGTFQPVTLSPDGSTLTIHLSPPCAQ